MALRSVLLLVLIAALACHDDDEKPSAGADDAGGGAGGADAGRSGNGGAGADAGNAGTGGTPQQDSGAGAGASGSGGSSDSGVSGSGGGESDSGVINAGMVDTESLFATLRSVQCGLYRTCCEDVGLATAGLDDCEQELEEQSERITVAIESGAIAIDGAALTACVAAASARAGSCEGLPRGWHHNDVIPPIAECSAAFIGTVAEGESCYEHVACAQGATTPSYCVPEGEICLRLPRGTLGDSCAMTIGPEFRSYPIKPRAEDDVACWREDGLQCAGSMGVFACAAVQATGDACTTEKECAADSYCDGTCQPRKASGESCANTAQCSDYGCSSATNTCTDHFVPNAFFCETFGF